VVSQKTVVSRKKNLCWRNCVLDGSKEERILDDEEKLRKTYINGELEKATLMEQIS
jgi:hypothetical protein